jgi:hypothetical protein
LKSQNRNRKLDEAFIKLKTNLGVILSNIKLRKEIEGSEFIMSFGKPQKEPWDQLRSSLQYIESFAVKHKKKCCFAFDEFGDIEKLDGIEIIKMFRGIIQNQKQSVYIFSGSYESVMNKIFVTSKSPFFRMVKIIEPGFINKQTVIDFVRSKFSELKIEYTDQQIIDSAEFTKGHPYYVRLFIQEYYFWFLQNNKVPDTDEIFKNMMHSENSYLEKLWDEVSKKRETKIVLMKIVETGKPYSGADDRGINISRAINDLLGKGMIFSDRAGYILSDPLFERFIKDRIIKD